MSEPELKHRIPPFVVQPVYRVREGAASRDAIGLVTLLISLVALIASMVGGTKLILDVFDDGLGGQLNGVLMAKVIALGLAFLFGWIMALISSRSFYNGLLPFLVQVLAWMCLVGVCLLDVRIIVKLYHQTYALERFFTFVLMMLGGIFVLAGLHLIVEGHDLRPFSIPLLLISVGHLVAIVYRYVFTEAQPGYLAGDLIFFFIMAATAGLMLAHFGILEPMRRLIGLAFDPAAPERA